MFGLQGTEHPPVVGQAACFWLAALERASASCGVHQPKGVADVYLITLTAHTADG